MTKARSITQYYYYYLCAFRNFDLEQKFAELTRMNIAQQRVERDLRDELSQSVTKAVSDADRRK